MMGVFVLVLPVMRLEPPGEVDTCKVAEVRRVAPLATDWAQEAALPPRLALGKRPPETREASERLCKEGVLI